MKKVMGSILHSVKVARTIIRYVGYVLLLALTLTLSNAFVACQNHEVKAAADPDLVVESLTWSPENPSKSDTVTISATVKNQGDGKAIISKLYFYVEGSFKEFQYVQSLEAGESITKDFTWVAQQGSHLIKLVIDEENEISESDENNNEKSATISTLTPDLIIQEIIWSPS
ncbi:CARDB domain-containing protein, partial [Chloroflexota bacterium]